MSRATKNLFPLGVATGAAHCNRKAEREALKSNIQHGTHTWLWARRRMGKTSLIEQVLAELKRARPGVPSVTVDLNVVHDAESLEAKIRGAAAALGVALLPKKQNPHKLLAGAFADFRPEFSVGGPGLKMTLRAPAKPADGIAEVLLALDAAARQAARRAVFVLDEFQQLSGLYYGQADTTLEGAIRHAVERATHISYVFCGSHRSLLADLFENPDRPLYRHCQKMTLHRIAADDYAGFLQGAAKARWGRALAEPVTGAVLSLTHRHPYYVNALCAELWRLSKPPGMAELSATWQQLVAQDSARVAQAVRRLSATQRAMLRGIAVRDQVAQPTSREFLAWIRLSASTGNAAKRVLEEEDLIRQTDDQHWELVDPIMKEYIRVNA